MPFESICEYCCIARLTSAVDAPAARHMSLNAMPSVVALSRPPVIGASCWTMPVSAGKDVGRPSIDLLIREMASDASSAEYPRFVMTFGKFAMVSTRVTAEPIELVTELSTLCVMPATTPPMAPALADMPLAYLSPALPPSVDAFADAPENALPSSASIVPFRSSNLGVSRTEPFATSAMESPLPTV